MNIQDALQWRYAVKKFSDKTIIDSDLNNLLACTRLTPSAFGLQPYKLIIVSSAAIREELLAHSMGQDKVVNSSHLIVFATDTFSIMDRIDRYVEKSHAMQDIPKDSLDAYADQIRSVFVAQNNAQISEWAMRQTYIAIGNFLTSAAMLKVDACPMEGIDKPAYDKVLGLKEKGLTTAIACPIGYRHKEDQYAQHKKVRFDFEELVLSI